MSHRNPLARRLVKPAAAAALVAALAVAVAGPAYAVPAEDDKALAPSISNPVAWLTGLLHGLIDPILDSADDRPGRSPGDVDRVIGGIGPTFDPNGNSPEPPAKSSGRGTEGRS